MLLYYFFISSVLLGLIGGVTPIPVTNKLVSSLISANEYYLAVQHTIFVATDEVNHRNKRETKWEQLLNDDITTTEQSRIITEDPTTEDPANTEDTTTVEGTNTTTEDTTTTEDPNTSTEDPNTTTEDPNTTTEDPTSTEEPQTTTEDPNTTTEDPNTTTEDPTSTEDPQTTTEDPNTTTEDPNTTTEDPNTTTEDPNTTTEDPTSTEDPQTTTEDPNTTTEDPNTTTEDPTSTEDPQTTTEDPNTTTEDPNTTTEDPNATTEDPNTTTEDPTSTEDPQTTTEDPNTTTEDPNTTTEDPTSTEDPQTTTEVPNTTTEDPNTTTEDPNATTEDPNTTTEDPNTTTEDPTSTEDPQTTTEDPNTTTEDPNTTTEDPNTTTENPNTTTEDPTSTEDPQTTTEDPYTTTEDPNTTTEDPNATTEDPNTTTEDPNTTTEAPTITEDPPIDEDPVVANVWIPTTITLSALVPIADYKILKTYQPFSTEGTKTVFKCTQSFLKRFQEELPNYTLTRDAAQNVQIKILATLPDSSDHLVSRMMHLMQVVASSHVVLSKFNGLYTTKMEELVRNIAELTAISPELEPVLSKVLKTFNQFTASFQRLTSLSQSFIVDAIEIYEKHKVKSEDLYQQLVGMDRNVSEAMTLRRILSDTLTELHEQRSDEMLIVVSEDDEKSNVSLEIFLINYDFLMSNMDKYMETCLHHLCYLRNPISSLSDRVKYLKKNFGDRLEHTLVPYIITRNEKTQMIVVKTSKTPQQPTVKNEEYVIKIMQLSASLYVHLSSSEKAIVTKCLEVTACIETLSSLSVNAVATLQNIQTRIRATSKQISKLIYFTIRLMNTAIDIKESFHPVNITALITALRSVAGYTSIALESIYLVENLVKELKERRDDIKKLDDEHNFLKDTFIINLEILLEMVEKYTLIGGQHLNLSRYKLYFLREYVKQLPQPKKADLDEFKYRKKNRKLLKVATEHSKNTGHTEEESANGDPNLDIASLHAAMKNVLEIDFPKPVDGFDESGEPSIKREKLSDSPPPIVKTEPESVKEEPEAAGAFYIKPEPIDVDDDDDDDSMPSNPGGDMEYHVINEQIVDGFIIREIKEEEAVDF